MAEKITADFSVSTGKVRKELYGSGLHIFTAHRHIHDNTEVFKTLRFPIVRNHDWALNNPNQRMIDVHHIFPLMHLDPADERNYVFGPSDEVIRLVYEAGSKVFYRLGTSIEHTEGVHFNANPPEDFEKDAEVCAAIIRHYTKGWNNGFHYDMKYWEIWNEPDLLTENGSATWQGTPEQFFELYRVTAQHLKKCFPKLKIGGPALAGVLKWMEKFLSAMKQPPRVPLDFFSWHFYGNNPKTAEEKAEIVRGLLDKAGYRKTESILNEWNYVRNWHTQFVYSIRQIIGLKGAAFNAAVMSSMQDAPVDMLMYYDARPTIWNGLFDFYTYAPLKSYYVFAAWAKLVRLGRQFEVDVKGKNGLTATGATDGKGRIGILFSRYFEQDDLPGELPLTLNVKGFDMRGAKLCLVDETHDLTEIPYRMDKDGNLLFSMKANTVMYLEAGKAEK